MSYISVNQGLCDLCGKCQEVCPFGAISISGSQVVISQECRLCLQCVKNCHAKALSLVKDTELQSPLAGSAVKDKVPLDSYRNIMVFAELRAGRFEPVTYELLGKARELADKIGQKVLVVTTGEGVAEAAKSLLFYNVDKVIVYQGRAFRFFDAALYADVLEEAIKRELPGILLIGATPLGRSLAPRLAVRMRTGLTADCTILDVRPDGELVQTRPAFGGNIMATIVTRNTRPQMATVRYKVFQPAVRSDKPSGTIEVIDVPGEEGAFDRLSDAGEHGYGDVVSALREKIKARSRCLTVLSETPLPRAQSISDAEVIVAVGRGLRSQKDIGIFEELAQSLGGVLACSRPLVEKGWFSSRSQVGLSGRTVRPKLYIALGISGAVQHVAGMSSSETIIAINEDRNAPIFNVAHYGIVGDMYKVVPEILDLIKSDSKASEG